MCKLFLMSLILTASLSLSFSTNNSNYEENNELYELLLSGSDLDVHKLAEDGWKKLVAEGRTRGVTDRHNFYIQCARVQIVDTERRYTILVMYGRGYPNDSLHCILIVMTNQTEPLSINCYTGNLTDYRYPEETQQRWQWSILYRDNRICPRKNPRNLG